MKYLKFTYIDALTGISVATEPAIHGLVFPPVAGLEFVWARESAYPTLVPEFFGTCHDDASVQIDGVFEVMSEPEWRAAHNDEMKIRLDAKSASVRQERNALLGSTDWTQVADAPVDAAAWAAYRQQLRDLTAQTGFPWTLDWPVAP